MISAVEAILSRRSVREDFSPKPVPAEVLEDILRCGLAAPSSKNAQPWRFHVVANRSLLRELAGLVEHSEGIETYVPYDPATGAPRPDWSSTVMESAAVLRTVPVAILIENTGPFSRGRQVLLKATHQALQQSIVGYMFEIIGVGAALQNMWIAAVAHGLSGVFMGDVLVAEREIQQRLKIECDLIGVLALGYSKARPSTVVRDRSDLNEDQVRWVQPG